MKKAYFISVLIAGVVTVGLSESPEVTIPKDKGMPMPAVHDVQSSQSEKAKEEVKRSWANMGRKFWGEERHVFPGGRYEVMRRGTVYDEIQSSEWMSPHVQRDQTLPIPPESEYLKEIASVLSIPVLKDDTPGDIAFKIKQCLGNVEHYRGNVLSDASFEKAKSAIRIPADAETFAEYHKFIKKIANRKVLIINLNE